MKKYFITDTDEELVFGDVVNVTLKKKTEHGMHTFDGELKLGPDTVDFLLEQGVIEMEDDEENDEESWELNGGNLCRDFNKITTLYEELENRVTDLEETVAVLMAKNAAKKK